MANFYNFNERNHSNSCPHCDLVDAAVEDIVESFNTYNPNSPVLYEQLREIIDAVYETASRNIITEIGLGLLNAADGIDIEVIEE